MGVGKDYVARSLGLHIYGFADPLYRIAEHYFGTSDKSKPGIRKFLQTVGQWGRGTNTDEYPYTTERAVFVKQMRKIGSRITGMGSKDIWKRYGNDLNFWIKVFLSREDLSDSDLAVTNGRFHNELALLKDEGFTHVHIMCAPSTYVKRLEELFKFTSKPNEPFPAAVNKATQDISEKMAKELDEACKSTVIWNDNLPKPNPNYLTIEEFRKLYGTIKR